ncbi:MAG: dihydropteroate synthase [Armatimonadota bacterium]
MLIVAERINTSRKIKGEPVVEKAVVSRNEEYIINLAKAQHEAGADYIDCNCGTLTSGEPEALEWLVNVVQGVVPIPISVDTPNPAAMEKALKACDMSRGVPFINSITAESERYTQILPFVKEYNAKVIALAMDDTGIQQDPNRRMAVARKLVENLTSDGIDIENIYIDPLTFPIGTGSDVAVSMLEIIKNIKAEYPGVKTIAGLSNISHGMPTRKLLNQAMTVLSLSYGLDGGIIDPNDKYLMGLIYATEALLGIDDFCMNYITKSREGRFDDI